MTIHLAAWLVWLLASFGYVAIGTLMWSFSRVKDDDWTTHDWLNYIINLSIFLLWPVVLAIVILWVVFGFVLLIAGVD
jgi:hypothetical protein